MSTMRETQLLVTLGIDTHADAHVAAALDHLGRELGTITVPTTTSGFTQLVEWASQFGVIDRVGIEGTGCWGAGLANACRGLRHVNFDVLGAGTGRPPDRIGTSSPTSRSNAMVASCRQPGCIRRMW